MVVVDYWSPILGDILILSGSSETLSKCIIWKLKSITTFMASFFFLSQRQAVKSSHRRPFSLSPNKKIGFYYTLKRSYLNYDSNEHVKSAKNLTFLKQRMRFSCMHVIKKKSMT